MNLDTGRRSAYGGGVKTITVAELRQNPTAALADVEAGETYIVTRHRRPVARLVPVDAEPLVIVPAKNPGGSRLQDRPRMRRYSYEETEALLAEMKSDW